MINRKSDDELRLMAQAGRILARIMFKVSSRVGPGLTTADIDRYAEELIFKEGALPAFKGYRGFPATTCISVNDEIVHGVPGERLLLAGDIVSIDLGLSYRGYFSDSAVTLAVGRIDSRRKKLIKVASDALREGIRNAYPGRHLGDISHGIQSYVEKNGFSVVRQFVGHGIGRDLHEEPEVPNFGEAGKGPVLESGMVLAIEPMINMGGWESEIGPNGWTALTKDGSSSAHFEHTVAITGKGPQVFTEYA